MSDLWIILTGLLVAIPCSLLGSYLVLRKMVMVGDAISHAVLPGIVFAFFFTQSFNSFYMLIGAALMGIFSTSLIEFFHKEGKLQEDASIGVTFTWMFAIGVILISTFLKNTDLDLDCVLYGEIVNTPFNLWITESGVNMGPAPVWLLGSVTVLVITLIVLSYKELFITTFDASFAQVIGISVRKWHYILMGAVSLTTVSSFESVGAILVVAFLVVPAATAYLLTDNFKTMLWLSTLLASLSVIIGYYVAVFFDVSASGTMTTVSGVIFSVVFIFSPSHGILSKKSRKTNLANDLTI